MSFALSIVLTDDSLGRSKKKLKGTGSTEKMIAPMSRKIKGKRDIENVSIGYGYNKDFASVRMWRTLGHEGKENLVPSIEVQEDEKYDLNPYNSPWHAMGFPLNMSGDDFEKLLNCTIKCRELETLLVSLGFQKKPATGSYAKWLKRGLPPLVIATHSKEIKPYQAKQVIQVLRIGGLL
jgi:hypothetical protein